MGHSDPSRYILEFHLANDRRRALTITVSFFSYGSIHLDYFLKKVLYFFSWLVMLARSLRAREFRMRRKSHLKLSVVQKSFDSSTKVIPSLHLISLIAVRDPWTARESQAQCDFAFIWRYFFRFGIRNCLATMSLLILGRTGGGGGGGGGWMPPPP